LGKEPGPIRKILPRLGEPLEFARLTPAHVPPTDWGKVVQAHAERDRQTRLPGYPGMPEWPLARLR
jgi:hypothetical protein